MGNFGSTPLSVRFGLLLLSPIRLLILERERARPLVKPILLPARSVAREEKGQEAQGRQRAAAESANGEGGLRG